MGLRIRATSGAVRAVRALDHWAKVRGDREVAGHTVADVRDV